MLSSVFGQAKLAHTLAVLQMDVCEAHNPESMPRSDVW